ncbi:MAG: hypothetical protein LC704_05860 [Actinobacteria bacterium]|nr:hypothetical protein [Actinomycetota bacterium]
MLLDLVRALPAALLVGVVPGWFWAGCLCATADRAERLAYSVAFSTTLVPTAALLQARLFGAGVTPATTAVSALLVLGTGLAVYLKFGPAKWSEEPLASRPVSLGLPTLIPLIAALALVLGALLGAVPDERVAPLIALSVLGAGIVHLLASPREDTAELREPSVVPTARWLLLSAVLLLVLLRSYPGPLRYDWPFPRGVDKYGHAVMVGMMRSEGSTESFMLYPPGFHVLAAGISGLSGLEPLELFAVLAPALLLLPALACYALARRLWGWEYGVAAALFSGLIAGGSYEHVSHARYPNLMGVFLLVLAVAALVRLYDSSSVRDQLTLAILGSSVVFYHMVASLYEAVLLALVGIVFLPYLLVRDRKRGIALLSSLALLGLLSMLYAWDTYDLPRLVAGLVGGSETGRGGEAVAMAIGTKPTGEFARLLTTTSQPALWFGLLGALLVVGDLLVRRDRMGMPQRLAYLTLLLWAVLLFAGSRTTMSSFPDRFERDLSVPLALLAALVLVAVLRSLRPRRPLTFAAAILTVTLVGVQAVQNLEEGFGPAQRWIDRPPPPKVVAAGEWLKENNEGGNLLSTPSVGPVSARGMLAMGGYSGIQTYSEHRIRRARDLPPSGAGPLWDALWALKNPGGERTERILSENDVRYVVLGKHRSDDMDWRSFQNRKDLYWMIFENESVVIFELREDQ